MNVSWIKNLQKSAFVLILANLITVYGVLALGWDVFPLLMLFWYENVIIGFYNVLRIAISKPTDDVSSVLKLFLIPFFCVHYGMFCFGHGVFLVALFGKNSGVHMGSPNITIFWEAAQQSGLAIGILALFISHGYSFIANFLLKGEYQHKSAAELMFRPYGRIVVLHILIILGGFLAAFIGFRYAGLFILILLKVGIDVYIHYREHRQNTDGEKPELKFTFKK